MEGADWVDQAVDKSLRGEAQLPWVNRILNGETIKLNLGAGEQRYKGYIGVDVRKTPACDIQHARLKPLPFPDNCASYIFCSHTLEHLPGHKAQAILRDWHRVLADKGILWGFVPDGEAACTLWLEAVKNEDEWAQKRLTDIILGGYATDYLQGPEQSHHMLYDARLMRAYLTDAGFQIIDVKREHPGKWDWRIAFYAMKGVYPEIEVMEPYFNEVVTETPPIEKMDTPPQDGIFRCPCGKSSINILPHSRASCLECGWGYEMEEAGQYRVTEPPKAQLAP